MFENFFGGLIKLIISLSAGALGVIPGIDGSDVAFSQFEFNVADNQIFISAQIQNELNPRIDDIIKSGRAVRLKITSECYKTSNEKESVKKKNIVKIVNYDVLKKQYEVTNNRTDLRKIHADSSLMWQDFLTIVEQSVFTSKDFPDRDKYFIKVTARLETELEIGGKSLDLMLFWNNKPPTAITDKFDNTIFIF